MPMTATLARTYPRTWPDRSLSDDDAPEASGSNVGQLLLRGEGAQTVKDGDLIVTPIIQREDGGVFGAEISGVNWTEPVSQDIVEQLVRLQDKYAVIVFRETGLDNARHIAFSQQLGSKLETNPFYYGIENDRVQEPFLWDVGNIELDGTIVQPDSRRWHHSLGNALWHTDSTYHQERSKYSLLLSHNTGPTGGSWTHFADTRRAYRDLPEGKKWELENMIVEHDLWHSRKLASPEVYADPTPEEKAKKPPAYHRLVQVAPNGEKTLFIAAHAKRILGKTIEESQKIMWDLIEWCTRPEYVFSMEWLQGGDMVWWDNRQSMHRANLYTTTMKARDVRRSTVIDDGPLAWGVTAAERMKADAGKPE